MKRLIIFLFTLVWTGNLQSQEPVNQTDANGRKQGSWVGKYPNGKIRYQGSFSNDKPIGEWKRFHDNGKLKAQLFHYPNSEKVAAELFDSNGIRYAKGNYLGTQKDSTWNYFNNARMVAQENFSAGRKNGRSATWFENGVLSSESGWTDGVLNGVSRSFYTSGKKKNELMYLNGKRHGLNLIYFESGTLQITGQYQNDEPDGAWKFMDADQHVRYVLNYNAGQLLNPEVIDSINANEFNAFDKARGRLKDPGEFTQSPEEYLRY